VHINIIV